MLVSSQLLKSPKYLPGRRKVKRVRKARKLVAQALALSPLKAQRRRKKLLARRRRRRSFQSILMGLLTTGDPKQLNLVEEGSSFSDDSTGTSFKRIRTIWSLSTTCLQAEVQMSLLFQCITELRNMTIRSSRVISMPLHISLGRSYLQSLKPKKLQHLQEVWGQCPKK